MKKAFFLTIFIIALASFSPNKSAATAGCLAGGCGSQSCTLSTGLAWWSQTVTVSCGSGFHSCCNIWGANCVDNFFCGGGEGGGGGGGCQPVPGSENGETEC